MPSQSLLALTEGIAEVRLLRDTMPGGPDRIASGLALTKALGRGAVVILSSHLEGYVDSINLEAVSALNDNAINPERLETNLRLLHAKHPLELLATSSWEGAPRARQLAEFIASDAWLWDGTRVGRLSPDRLLMWMKSPAPENLMRYFRYWGIADIFNSITRATRTRDAMWMRLAELVDKRNSIAHGDSATSASRGDLTAYIDAVEAFATRADAVFARRLAVVTGTARPW